MSFRYCVSTHRFCPRGFTLIELVLAIFVFAIGALGLAATTAVITRSLAMAGIRERAARLATARIEALRGLSCASVHSGSESVQGLVSSWTVTPAGTRVDVVETVTYGLNGSPRTDSYSSLFRCQP